MGRESELRRTKSGAIHKHSKRMSYKDWRPADPRQMLWWETKHYLAMLERYGSKTIPEAIAVAACRNLLEQLGKEQS